MVLPAPSSFRHRFAADILAAGGVVCHPTEAVWGLACLPHRHTAVARICALKGRPVGKGLILVADCAERFAGLLARLPEQQRQAVLATWPGPHTWLLPIDDSIPAWICGDHDTVAVRVSNHPLTAGLCAAADSALVSTSANPAGEPAARRGWQARRYFGDAVDCYLQGDTGGRKNASSIRDAMSGARIR